MYYGEVTITKIWKIEKIMIEYSSYTNYLWFSVRCPYNKILQKDLQLKYIIKTKQSKIVLQGFGKLWLQEQTHINHVIRDKLNDGIKQQLKGKVLECFTP